MENIDDDNNPTARKAKRLKTDYKKKTNFS